MTDENFKIALQSLCDAQNLTISAMTDLKNIMQVWEKNFERFAERITAIEMHIFGKSED